MKRITLKKSLFSFLIVFSILFMTACGDLDERNFDTALRGYQMKAVVQKDNKKNPDKDGVLFWKYAGSDSRNISIQYIVFDSENSAKNFAKSQQTYISDSIGNGSSKGSYFSGQAEGYYYYVTNVEDKVIIATCEMAELDNLKKMLNRMPKVTVE